MRCWCIARPACMHCTLDEYEVWCWVPALHAAILEHAVCLSSLHHASTLPQTCSVHVMTRVYGISCSGGMDAGTGELDICEQLFAEGLAVNMTDKSGWTPLLWAASGGHTTVSRKATLLLHAMLTRIELLRPVHQQCQSSGTQV